jgi:hypothetical protein
MTERDQSRDRPGDEMVRVTVAEAARRLSISEAGVRKRIQRDQIPHERDDEGRVWVWVSPGEVRHAETRDESDQSRDESDQSRDRVLVDELRDRVAYLERQVEEEREARRRADTILAQLSQANAEQARTIRAIEAPPAELPEGPETAADATDRGDVPGAHNESQEAQEERLAWHKKWEYRGLLVLGAIAVVSTLGLVAFAVLSP